MRGWLGAVTSVTAACSFTPGALRVVPAETVDGGPDGAPDVTLIDVPAGSGVITFGERAAADRRNVTADAYVESANPTVNAGAALGIWGDATPITNGLLRFDLSSLTPGTLVTAATLHVTTNIDSLESGAMEFYPVLESWEEASASWNNRATSLVWGNAGASAPGSRGAQLVGAVMPNVDFTAYAVTLHVPTVQGWIDDPATNHGLVMISTSPSGNGGMFSSREDPIEAVRPMLEISYGP